MIGRCMRKCFHSPLFNGVQLRAGRLLNIVPHYDTVFPSAKLSYQRWGRVHRVVRDAPTFRLTTAQMGSGA